jgi:dolichol-phosphate mannosyltransferase
VLVVVDKRDSGATCDAAKAAGAQTSCWLASGIGALLQHGLSRGLADGYDVIVTMDADGQHKPEEIPKLVSALKDADLVVGVRPRKGRAAGMGSWRALVSSTAARLSGTDFPDPTSGFRAYSRKAAEIASKLPFRGYYFQVAAVRHVQRSGGKVVGMPITFATRMYGESKLNWREMARWWFDRLRDI